ncbi:PAS domain S-box-containing protein [Tistlia consotensis]|uniref:PAS domain S-box-containing protein n=1 Tax=Tistlia consotensis USBA 355 TaxID=560819 RepID=A0A1Y6CP01_9PROT|nr:PAS domain-containing protein [Tistlia consotensis]SMF80915.1 PAS domain S-box-containing protein [Tistlia consotensis USBA 355]SNS22061.1 PAS domain S-box-containing protein [Tistlia consotensis]
MSKYAVRPTGRESLFREGELIVSKTDLKGRITYCNDVFRRIAGFTEEELLGAPHSIIRHPDMPRCVFKLLWDTIEAKGEIFAYVINLAKNGDHYWVLAHVTPTLDAKGNIVGYHSNRRKPRPEAVAAAAGLYRELKAIEDAPSSRKEGMQEAYAHFIDLLAKKGVSYDRFLFSL